MAEIYRHFEAPVSRSGYHQRDESFSVNLGTPSSRLASPAAMPPAPLYSSGRYAANHGQAGLPTLASKVERGEEEVIRRVPKSQWKTDRYGRAYYDEQQPPAAAATDEDYYYNDVVIDSDAPSTTTKAPRSRATRALHAHLPATDFDKYHHVLTDPLPEDTTPPPSPDRRLMRFDIPPGSAGPYHVGFGDSASRQSELYGHHRHDAREGYEVPRRHVGDGDNRGGGWEEYDNIRFSSLLSFPPTSHGGETLASPIELVSAPTRERLSPQRNRTVHFDFPGEGSSDRPLLEFERSPSRSKCSAATRDTLDYPHIYNGTSSFDYSYNENNPQAYQQQSSERQQTRVSGSPYSLPSRKPLPSSRSASRVGQHSERETKPYGGGSRPNSHQPVEVAREGPFVYQLDARRDSTYPVNVPSTPGQPFNATPHQALHQSPYQPPHVALYPHQASERPVLAQPHYPRRGPPEAKGEKLLRKLLAHIGTAIQAAHSLDPSLENLEVALYAAQRCVASAVQRQSKTQPEDWPKGLQERMVSLKRLVRRIHNHVVDVHSHSVTSNWASYHDVQKQLSRQVELLTELVDEAEDSLNRSQTQSLGQSYDRASLRRAPTSIYA